MCVVFPMLEVMTEGPVCRKKRFNPCRFSQSALEKFVAVSRTCFGSERSFLDYFRRGSTGPDPVRVWIRCGPIRTRFGSERTFLDFIFGPSIPRTVRRGCVGAALSAPASVPNTESVLETKKTSGRSRVRD